MSDVKQFDRHLFWQFSVDFYQNEEVQKTCLMLQDDYDLNVNLTLFLLWYSLHTRNIIEPYHIEHLLDVIVEPGEWVSEFRGFRRELWQRMHHSNVDIQKDMKQAMLEFELKLESQVQMTTIEYANEYLSDTGIKRDRSENLIELNFIAGENLDVYFHFMYPGNNQHLWEAQQTLLAHLLDYCQHQQAA